jgi:predicted LPLAT superfamily acyltransferase
MERNWSGKTQGGTFGQKSVLFYFKYGSLKFAYFILYLIIPFYLFFDKKGYRAMKWYALNCIKVNPNKVRSFIFKVYHNFGQVFLDRFAIFGNNKNKFNFNFINNEVFEKLLQSEKGFMIVSAHVGNFELLSYSIGKIAKTIHPILYGGEAIVFQKLRETVFKGNNIEPILLNETGSYIFEINCALSNGDIVSMPADRTFGKIKYFEHDFLGYKADFPSGVFQIAIALDIPVVSIFVVKDAYKTYRVHVEKLEVDFSCNSKKEMALNLGTSYVKNLETIIQKYPTQWYNFYPFWNQQL